MKTCAIISEYNPFHNGHAHHVEESRKKSQADYIIAIMSGNFVQRGEPALLNKWERAKAALLNGIDLVIEVPFLYATSSGEYFARAGVDIANKLNIVDYLSFGSERNDLKQLKESANKRINTPIKKEIAKATKDGLSYPRAMERIFNDPSFDSNDLLGLSYIIALKRTKSKIEPITIKRQGSTYKEEDISSINASAFAIRKTIKESEDLNILKDVMPESSLNILLSEIEKGRAPIFLKDFEAQLVTKIRTLGPNGLSRLPHVSPGLDYRLYKNAIEEANIEKLIDLTVSKSYTKTRIQRLCLHALMEVSHSDLNRYSPIPYIRVLGFRKDSSKLIEKLNESAKLPLIYRPSKDIKKLSKRGLELFNLESLASDLYCLAYKDERLQKGKQDLTNPLVIV